VRPFYFALAGVVTLAHAAAFALGVTDARAQQAPAHIITGMPPPPNYIPPLLPPNQTGGQVYYNGGPEFDISKDFPIFNWVYAMEYGIAASGGSHLGGPVNVSMYSPAFAGLDFSGSQGHGIRVSDTAGIITNPNASAGYRAFDGGGGVNLSVDASRLFDLPVNQRFWFGLSGDFNFDAATFSSSGLPGGTNANAGSVQRDTYTLTNSATYTINNYYVRGSASFDWNHADITNNQFIPGAHGDTNGRGYLLDTTVGSLFPLVNTIAVNPETVTKAPPANPGGYALLVDTSVHYSYSRGQEDGFTDNTGFAYGTQQSSFSDVGARARLTAIVPDHEFLWMPYVGATFDQEFGLSSTWDIPAQAVTPADTVIFSPSTTFWGAELGLNILSRGGTRLGMKAFYEASADTQTLGGSAYLRIPFEEFAALNDSGIRIAPARALPVKAPPPPPLPAYWNWAGLYVGGHVGAALSIANFSDPFGSTIYGDQVRSPGFLGGGQIGYNWQAPRSPWVFGVEADGSLMSSDGDVTCFAASFMITTTTCRVQPQATGTFTGRIGYALGPSGRTLVYAKGGLGWANDEINMALNGLNDGPTRASAIQTGNSQTVTLWGGTVGVGVEEALTPAWSLKAEYDYLDLGRGNITNIGGETLVGFAQPAIAPSTSGVSQNIHELKLGMNYKWGADPWAPGWSPGPIAYLTRTPPLTSAGWEVEGGGRYFASWGQFQKDLGGLKFLGEPASSMESRLTYDNMQTNSGEFFGRIETPWNFFVKGYIGGGVTNSGKMYDEDAALVNLGLFGPYSNTLSPAVTGNISYGAIDGGFDIWRAPTYKVGVFAGYFAFNQNMSAFGCVVVAFNNCSPNPVPTSGSAVITESDEWTAVRIGLAAETMLTDRLKLSGDVAYLPWVWFSGTDQHFVGNTGALAEIFQASGKGNGVQIDALLSYYLTRQWSVGLGGRYWGMWTTPNGEWTCTSAPCLPTFAQPSYFRAQVEQLGAFVQMAYKFDWSSDPMATLH
jgi:opacity protein-like surface antigen